MPVFLSPEQLKVYCGARGIELDDYVQPRVVTCTRCRSSWLYTAEVDWHRCARGCSRWLDSYPEPAKAARMLDAHRPPLAPALDPPAVAGDCDGMPAAPDETQADGPPQPLRRGRPQGSSSVTVEEIKATFDALKISLARRPTRKEVAHELHVSTDALDYVLKRAGVRFSELR